METDGKRAILGYPLWEWVAALVGAVVLIVAGPWSIDWPAEWKSWAWALGALGLALGLLALFVRIVIGFASAIIFLLAGRSGP